MMNFIGHEIDDFKVNAYQDGKTKEVTKNDVLGSGVFSSSTQLTSHLFAQLNLKLSKISMMTLRKLMLIFTQFPKILNLSTRHGLKHQKRLARLSTTC